MFITPIAAERERSCPQNAHNPAGALIIEMISSNRAVRGEGMSARRRGDILNSQQPLPSFVRDPRASSVDIFMLHL